MLVNRFVFYSGTFIMMIALLMSGINPLAAGGLTLIIVMTAYIVWAYQRSKSRLNLLDVACDPVAFLARTEQQMAITGRNVKIAALLNIDKSAALITLGQHADALALLRSIDPSKITNNNAQVAYNINLILCYYGLDDLAQAELLFETQMPLLAPTHPKVKMAVNILIGERYYFLGKYEESKALLENILTKKISKRVYLTLMFRLAEIHEIAGDTDKAIEKYKQVSEKGNQLFVAAKAKERLAVLV